jgi:hypothetical protein
MPDHRFTTGSKNMLDKDHPYEKRYDEMGRKGHNEVEINILDEDSQKSEKTEGTPLDARGEERWHTSIEELAKEWRNNCDTLAVKHDSAGYKARMKHLIFGLPAPITSLVVTAVAGLWLSPNAKYFIVPASCVAAVFSVVHVQLNLAGKAQQYWDFSARFGSMASKIDHQLVRHEKFRRPADEFMAETRVELGNLQAYAPQLPGNGCCGCSNEVAE